MPSVPAACIIELSGASTASQVVRNAHDWRKVMPSRVVSIIPLGSSVSTRNSPGAPTKQISHPAIIISLRTDGRWPFTLLSRGADNCEMG